jgi:glycosyltransferase involved in cell wall biosynthesis
MTSEDIGVSVIILTLNEEENVKRCLESIVDWADEIHIVDGDSTDATISIASKYTENIHAQGGDPETHEYASIRNWALETLSINNNWALFLDADERLTSETKQEINRRLSNPKDKSGYYIHKRHIFLGRWIKYGRQYNKELRLSKVSKTEYIDHGDTEYATIQGTVGTLEHDLIHDDQKPFSDWVQTHNQLSERKAKRYLNSQPDDVSLSKLNTAEEVTVEGEGQHWLMEQVWDRIPLLLRPFTLFFYTYIIKQGFRDGIPGFIFYIHHKFWYQFLIATKVYEIKWRNKSDHE